MPKSIARSEHTQQLISLVAHAIRAAALAPSEREALDIVGAALVLAVALVKADSNQCSTAVLGLFSAN